MTRRGVRGIAVALVAGLMVATTTAAAAAGPEPTRFRTPPILGPRVDCSARTACTVAWELAKDTVTVFVGPSPATIDHDHPVTRVPAATTEVTVTGLDPATPHYFLLTVGTRAHGQVVGDRSLRLDSAPATSDLGGYGTVFGLEVRWGTVFRSGSLDNASAPDRDRLAQAGIRVVYDLRGASTTPTAAAPIPGATLTVEPLGPGADPVATALHDARSSPDGETRLAGGGGEALMTAAFERGVTDPDARRALAAVLRGIAHRRNLPALLESETPFDRSAWATAVLLRILGVPRETVFSGYLASGQTAAGAIQATIDAAATTMRQPELLRPLLEPRRGYLEAAFQAANDRYGSFDRFVRRGLRLHPATITALRNTLLSANDS